MAKTCVMFVDLKPENIVFSLPPDSPTSDIVVKIIDFGVGMIFLTPSMHHRLRLKFNIASHQNEDRSRPITNPYWRSPECWLGMPWGPPADIWSFGAIVRSLIPLSLASYTIATNQRTYIDGLLIDGTRRHALPAHGRTPKFAW